MGRTQLSPQRLLETKHMNPFTNVYKLIEQFMVEIS